MFHCSFSCRSCKRTIRLDVPSLTMVHSAIEEAHFTNDPPCPYANGSIDVTQAPGNLPYASFAINTTLDEWCSQQLVKR